MAAYLVNKIPQPTGEHEVHKIICDHLPEYYNRQNLGEFNSCQEAVQAARRYYSNVDGCAYCCPACHKR